MNKTIISTEKAPAAIGPYSQALRVGYLVLTSGHIAFKTDTRDLVQGDVQAQTRQCMDNVKAILEAAGTSLDNCVKCTLFIKDMNQFGQINEVYGTYFGDNPPARACVEVARLPMVVLIEVEAIALVK